MSNQNINNELYTELAYEFANALIGDGRVIIKDRDDHPEKEEAFHIITANCNSRILKVVNGKPIYPNWFLDPTKNPTNGKYSIAHFIFRKAVFDLLKEKIGENHNIYVKYVIVNKDEKIFSIHFLHNRKKESTTIDDCSWISHKSGDIDGNDSFFIKHSSIPVRTPVPIINGKPHFSKDKKFNRKEKSK